MSGEQNIGDFPAAEFRRARVLRTFEQPAGEAIVGRGLLVTEYAGEQPNDRIDEDDRSDRAIGEDVISDRNLRVDQLLDNAVVHSFVMPADDDKMFLRREFASDWLRETPALWRHENDRTRGSTERLNRGEDWLRFHHHPLPSSEGRVIDDVVAVGRPIAQIMDAEVEHPGLLGAPHHAFA